MRPIVIHDVVFCSILQKNDRRSSMSNFELTNRVGTWVALIGIMVAILIPVGGAGIAIIRSVRGA
jgi:hypothetical protein